MKIGLYTTAEYGSHHLQNYDELEMQDNPAQPISRFNEYVDYDIATDRITSSSSRWNYTGTRAED